MSASAEPGRAVGLRAEPCETLSGRARVPGDKSISHRALILGGLTVGATRIRGLLEGEDVLMTAEAMRAFGAEATREGNGVWTVHGRGVGGLAEPDRVLWLGNSGTGARLLMGVAAGHPFTTFFDGDASLRRRPMDRVLGPLEEMGAAALARSGRRLPLAVTGGSPLLPLDYEVPVPSAQVKSALLLAALHAPGTSTVTESAPTRDHGERLLRAFGAELAIRHDGATRRITVSGQPELRATALDIPGDPSSAAFPLAAAACLPGSEVTLLGVGTNPLRTGLIDTLIEMGAEIEPTRAREEGGEPVADIVVRGRRLRGVEVPPWRAPTMIDEYPVLGAAAACAEGRTVLAGLAELRIKETDRLAAMARGLTANGVAVEEAGDGLVIHGRGGRPPGGGHVRTCLDHRIAMAFLVLGLLAERAVAIDDARPIATSFPGFVALMEGLGARLAR